MKIGINGFGRIGRCLLRLGLEDLDIIAINSPSSIETAAHLLKYDSVHGVYNKEVAVNDNVIQVGNKKINYSSFSHPSDIPWDQWKVDLVLECSGVFKKRKSDKKLDCS